jgi:C8 domain
LLCEQFFKQKTSYLLNCFNVLDPIPFYEMCLNLGNQRKDQSDSKYIEKTACTSAIAYIEACSAQRVPLRIPDTCI